MEVSLKRIFMVELSVKRFELEMRSTMTKHNTYPSDRNDIQLGLERDETFKTIEQFILKDPTTVSKEIKQTKQTSPRV